MGFRTRNEWTYYSRFRLVSYGNGAAYALYYINDDGTETDTAYLQDDWKLCQFEQALDAVDSFEDMRALWECAFYDDWELPIVFGGTWEFPSEIQEEEEV